MKIQILPTLFFLSLCMSLQAQWSMKAGLGLSLPITGYGKVVDPGMNIFNIDASRSLGQGNMSLGLNIQMSRFSEDAAPEDAFYDAKLTVAPLLVVLEYTMNKEQKLRPYLSGGLGVTFFEVSYNSSPTGIDNQSISNLSFTTMPLVGLKYQAGSHLFPFLETGFVLVMDGPPIGFPEANQITGYQFIRAGVEYNF